MVGSGLTLTSIVMWAQVAKYPPNIRVNLESRKGILVAKSRCPCDCFCLEDKLKPTVTVQRNMARVREG